MFSQLFIGPGKLKFYYKHYSAPQGSTSSVPSLPTPCSIPLWPHFLPLCLHSLCSRHTGLPNGATAPALPSAWDTRDPGIQQPSHWVFPHHSTLNCCLLPLHSLWPLDALFFPIALITMWHTIRFYLCIICLCSLKGQHQEGRDFVCFAHCCVPSTYNSAWHSNSSKNICGINQWCQVWEIMLVPIEHLLDTKNTRLYKMLSNINSTKKHGLCFQGV